MKQIFNRIACLTFALACLVGTVDAQAYRRPYHRSNSQRSSYFRNGDNYTGIRVGMNVSSLTFDFNNRQNVDKSSLVGLNVGLVEGILLTDQAPLYFEPGIFYTQKGVKGVDNSESLKVNMHYFEVPFVFKYRLDLDNTYGNMSIQPFFGGFASVGFAGKIKEYDARVKTNTFSEHAFNNLDAGLRMGCGFQYDQFYLEASYDLGLANVARSNFNHLGYDDFDDRVRTSTFAVTVGVNF